MTDDKREREAATDNAYRQHVAQTAKQIRERDKDLANAGRMYASDFARERGVNPRRLRERMRAAGYDRRGRNLIPVGDLERFVKE